MKLATTAVFILLSGCTALKTVGRSYHESYQRETRERQEVESKTTHCRDTGLGYTECKPIH